VTDALSGLWLATLQEVVGLAAHEVKNPLNGLSVNLEVVRSRIAAGRTDPAALTTFAEAAYQQLGMVIARSEALLRIARGHRPGDGPANVSQMLMDLGTLLGDVAAAKGGRLQLDGVKFGIQTSADPVAVRLALAVGVLALIKEGGVGLVRVEPGPETVVRFSHESAAVGDIDPAIAAALGPSIRARRSDKDLQFVFPGHS
jgi:signal transduction histidine kinase